MCISMYVSVLRCISMYVSVLRCISMYVSVLRCISMYFSVLQCISMHLNVLRCIFRVFHVFHVLQYILCIPHIPSIFVYSVYCMYSVYFHVLHHHMSLTCCIKSHCTPATLAPAHTPCLFSIDLHTVKQHLVIVHFLLLLLLSGTLFQMMSGVPHHFHHLSLV